MEIAKKLLFITGFPHVSSFIFRNNFNKEIMNNCCKLALVDDGYITACMFENNYGGGNL